MDKIDTAFELINLFHDNNYEAYLIGGSVRDLLMSREIKDIDITTNALPFQIKEVAKKLGLKYIETGIQHGTITIVYNDVFIEVTTFRVDLDCDGRHCNVRFVRSLKKDLSRRDFTINAIALDRNGNPIDLFNGVLDIQNKVIRAVGNPNIRFEEDKLRALRAIRFATVLNFDIEQHTYNAIKNVSLEFISKERIKDEFIKVLLSSNKIRGVELLRLSGLMDQIIPEITILKDVLQDEINHPEKDVYTHTILSLKNVSDNNYDKNDSLELILSILLHDIGKPLTRSFESEHEIHFYEHEKYGAEITEAILTRLKFPTKTIEKVKWLVENHMRIHHFNEMKKSKKVKLIEHEHFSDLMSLAIADIEGSSALNGSINDLKIIYNIDKFIGEYREEIKNIPILKQKLINGFDIMNLGVSPKEGIKIGQILEKVNDAIIEENINTKEEALKYAKGLI